MIVAHDRKPSEKISSDDIYNMQSPPSQYKESIQKPRKVTRIANQTIAHIVKYVLISIGCVALLSVGFALLETRPLFTVGFFAVCGAIVPLITVLLKETWLPVIQSFARKINGCQSEPRQKLTIKAIAMTLVLLLYIGTTAVGVAVAAISAKNALDTGSSPIPSPTTIPVPSPMPPLTANIKYDITRPFFAQKGQTEDEVAKHLSYTLQSILKSKLLTEEQIYNSEYSALASKADNKYTEKNPGSISDSEWAEILVECISIRVRADDEFLQLSSNQRLIGVYYFELHDTYLRIGKEDQAHDAILASIKYTAFALISTYAENGEYSQPSVCIKQLKNKCYPRLRDMKETTSEEKEMIDTIIAAFELVLQGNEGFC